MDDEARTFYVLYGFLGLQAFPDEVSEHAGGKARSFVARLDGLLLGEEV